MKVFKNSDSEKDVQTLLVDTLIDGESVHEPSTKDNTVKIEADVVIIADEGVADLISGIEERS